MVRAFRWVSLVLFILVGSLYAFSGVLIPAGVVPLLWLVWIAHLVVVIRQWKKRLWVVVSAPLISYFFWVAAIQVGSLLFGWSA